MRKITFGFVIFLVLIVHLSASSLTGNDELLHEAVKAGNLKKVKFALKMGADINALGDYRYQRMSVLMTASKNGNYKLVKFLIENKANIDLQNKHYNNKYTALMFAVENAHIKIVNYLIKKGADLSIEGEYFANKRLNAVTALSIAKNKLSFIHINAEEKKIYKQIIRLLQNPSKTLIEATRRGDYEIVLQSIKDGADVNIKDENGWSPLMIAIAEGYKKIARYLRLKGAKVDPKVKNIK